MNRSIKSLSLISLLFWIVLGCSCSNSSSDIGASNDINPVINVVHIHSLEKTEAKNPTCVEEGITAGLKCSICNEWIVAPKSIPALGHKTIHVPAKESGISFEGYSEYDYCSNCGEMFTPKEPKERLEFCENLCSFIDNFDNLYFSWKIHRENIAYKSVVTVNDGNNLETHELINNNSCTLKINKDTLYKIDISTIYEDSDSENPITFTRYVPSEFDELPIIKIESANYEIPTGLYKSPPYGLVGQTIVNNDYVQCLFEMYNNKQELVFASSESNDIVEKYSGAKIKIRGNTSSYKEKKPYKLKLSSKEDLLSYFDKTRSGKHLKDKEWLLIDGAVLQTIPALFLSNYIRDDWSPKCIPVDLVFNGDYRGVYLLIESIKRGNESKGNYGRVPISDNGFLIENDPYWWSTNVSFGTDRQLNGQFTRYTFKYPDEDDVLTEDIEYIKNYVNNFENSLLQDDDTYLDYCEVESFAGWLLTHDILGTIDGSGSNMYMSKFDREDSKLVMGPPWDFDSSFYAHDFCPNRNQTMFITYLLTQKTAFIEAYSSLLNKVKEDICDELRNYLFNDIGIDKYQSGINLNDLRWNPSLSTSLNDTYEYYIKFVEDQLLWLEQTLSIGE